MKKRAFVRYSKQGKIVPGSLILTSGSYPQGSSTWKEVPADLCCESITISTQVANTAITNVSIRIYCNSTEVADVISNQNSTDGSTLATILNEEFGVDYGTFAYVTDGTVILTTNKGKELCPNGYLSFEIYSD